MDALSLKTSAIHRIKPLQKFIVTLFFLVIVISFKKYSVSQLLPLFLYPAMIIVLGEVPLRFLLKTILPVLPLILLLGATNPIFDRADWVLMPGITINAGWVSAFAIVVRSLLVLTASFSFMATTGMNGLITALEKLKVPEFFLMILAFIYRYIHLLQEEAVRIIKAYNLRALGQKGVVLKDWGSLGGQWFIRTYKRAEGIHAAMICRGFSEKVHRTAQDTIGPWDYTWTTFWSGYFLLCRFFHLPKILGDYLLWIIQ